MPRFLILLPFLSLTLIGVGCADAALMSYEIPWDSLLTGVDPGSVIARDAVNGAAAVFQLTFTDLDLTSFPVPPGSILPLFATIGLVDADLNPKAALSAWDSLFTRPPVN